MGDWGVGESLARRERPTLSCHSHRPLRLHQRRGPQISPPHPPTPPKAPRRPPTCQQDRGLDHALVAGPRGLQDRAHVLHHLLRLAVHPFGGKVLGAGDDADLAGDVEGVAGADGLAVRAEGRGGAAVFVGGAGRGEGVIACVAPSRLSHTRHVSDQ